MTVETARKRGPYAPTVRRRAEIAEAVLAIVDSAGPDALTVAQVAEDAGVNESTVLYHFPTKDHLLVAALELADERNAAAVGVETRMAGDLNAEVPDIDIAAFAAEVLPAHRQRLVALVRGLAALPGHPARDYLQQRTTRAREIWTRLISRRQVEGHAHPGIDAHTAACQYLALLDGLDGLTALGVEIDVVQAKTDGFRRLTGADWMQTRARLLSDDFGL